MKRSLVAQFSIEQKFLCLSFKTWLKRFIEDPKAKKDNLVSKSGIKSLEGSAGCRNNYLLLHLIVSACPRVSYSKYNGIFQFL